MNLEEFFEEWHSEDAELLVRTSGSTGKPRPIWIEKKRMLSSARTTCNFLGLHPGNTALLCMPLDYIAGKMMVVRSIERGLKLIDVRPSGHPLADDSLPREIDFAAMVPIQVLNSLENREERNRLRNIRHLIIGGGMIDNQLAEDLKDFPNAIWSTYGMTETLSHIAFQRLNGSQASQWYEPLDGVDISFARDGCLTIYAPEVNPNILRTNDLVEIKINPSGKTLFKIKGRKDNVINSGGLKIQIEEIECLLRPYISLPFMITKCYDQKLGEAVVLLTEHDKPEELAETAHCILPKYHCPRYYIHIDHLPTTVTGKPARRQAEEIASRLKK